jgi:hypothetical protein
VYLRLIDTPGEMHDTRGPKHYSSADVFLICFSIISPTSVHSVLDRVRPLLVERCRCVCVPCAMLVLIEGMAV